MHKMYLFKCVVISGNAKDASTLNVPGLLKFFFWGFFVRAKNKMHSVSALSSCDRCAQKVFKQVWEE